MRKYLAAFVAVAALFFLSGCGTSGGSDGSSGSSGSSSSSSSSGSAVAVDTWAADFCGNFSDWLDAIQKASSEVGNDVTPGDVAGAKTAVSNLFGAAADETQSLIDSLKAGGYPDIKDGQGLVDELVTRFEQFEKEASDAQAKVDALATDDGTTFQSEVTSLTNDFKNNVNDIGDSFSALDTKYPDQDLQQALSDSCQF